MSLIETLFDTNFPSLSCETTMKSSSDSFSAGLSSEIGIPVIVFYVVIAVSILLTYCHLELRVIHVRHNQNSVVHNRNWTGIQCCLVPS